MENIVSHGHKTAVVLMSQEEPALQQNPKKYLQLCMCVRGLHELLLRVCGSFGCRMSREHSIFCLGVNDKCVTLF